MAGKWTKYRGKLPKLPVQSDDPTYGEKVDQRKAELLDRSDEALAQQLVEMKDEVAAIEARVKDLGATREAINQILVSRWEEKGQEKVTFTFGTFSIGDEPYPSVKDEAKLFEWLKKQKLGDLIKKTVNWQTLKAAVKEQLEDGKPVPTVEDSGMSLFLKQIIKVGKA